MADEEKTKMYFINKTSGRVGTFYADKVTRTPQDNGKDKVEIMFEKKGKENHKVEYYFNEQEWLDDIRKM